MFIYSDTSANTGPIDLNALARCDANKKYLEHYSNLLMLKVFLVEGTTVEKLQAAKEITICERKLTYWTRHERYDQKIVTEGCSALKKQWNGRV